jgi:hypothetical protein
MIGTGNVTGCQGLKWQEDEPLQKYRRKLYTGKSAPYLDFD